MAVVEAGKGVLWMKDFIGELGFPARGLPAPLRQSKCHPPCQERGVPLQDEAYPACRGPRVRVEEDSHGEKQVRHAD